MNLRKACALLVGLLVLAGASAAMAAEGWSLPNLNPFSQKESEPAPRRPAAHQTRRVASEPSTWERFTSGTKNLVGKTTDKLTPWKKKPAPRRLPFSAVQQRFH